MYNITAEGDPQVVTWWSVGKYVEPGLARPSTYTGEVPTSMLTNQGEMLWVLVLPTTSPYPSFVETCLNSSSRLEKQFRAS
jgi:hypothetical protein